MRNTVFTLVALLLLTACGERAPQTRWFKGNTHTHTLWSDGDAAPERVTDWYVKHDYDFLVLSDHNILSQGERWFPVSKEGRLTPTEVDALIAWFGGQDVDLRTRDDQVEMRLKTLDELRERFEEPGSFLFIQGEEISDAFAGRSVHVNGLNLEEKIDPQGGETVQEVIQWNIDAVIEQGRRLGRPTMAHLNHPNFEWALTPEDVAAIRGEHFFEVYNGHSSVRNHGDADHPSTEQIWDLALHLRLTRLGLGLLYGLATDDAHHYSDWGLGHPNPGRGWVMVRAPELTASALLSALEDGEFYGSSGVTLRDFRRRGDRFLVEIEPEEGVTYTTRFIGCWKPGTRTGSVGEVFFETTGNPAVYRITGDELYVRATVISSKLHPNPYAEGDHETAWVQPILP